MNLTSNNSNGNNGSSKKKVSERFDLTRTNLKLELSIIEQRAEIEAKDLNLTEYPRIQRVRGTISYLIKELGEDDEARNYSVAEFLEESGDPLIDRILFNFKKLDEDSQKRQDVFDHLCRIWKINPSKIYKHLGKVLKEYDNIELQVQLRAEKDKLIARVSHFGGKEDNFEDRKLMASITGMEQKQNVDNRTIIDKSNRSQNLIVEMPSFTQDIREIDTLIRGPQVLEEGTQKMIEERSLSSQLEENVLEGELMENER